MQKSQLKTAPATEPITSTQAKTQLRLSGVTLTADEDSQIDAFIKSARMIAEKITNRPLITQTWYLYLDCFPERIQLPKMPVIAVNSIRYYDDNNAIQTYSSSDYESGDSLSDWESHIVVTGDIPTIVASDEREWPVEVDYDVGYGAAAAVPSAIKEAILIMITNLWNGDPVVTDTVENLLHAYKVQ